MSPSTGHQDYHTCCSSLENRVGSSLVHRADVKRRVRMLFSYLLTFIPWDISSCRAARTVCVLSFICKVAYRRPACLYCRRRRLHICLPPRRCVCIKVAFLFQSDGTCRTGTCDCRMQMREQDARARSFPPCILLSQILVKWIESNECMRGSYCFVFK